MQHTYINTIYIYTRVHTHTTQPLKYCRKKPSGCFQIKKSSSHISLHSQERSLLRPTLRQTALPQLHIPMTVWMTARQFAIAQTTIVLSLPWGWLLILLSKVPLTTSFTPPCKHRLFLPIFPVNVFTFLPCGWSRRQAKLWRWLAEKVHLFATVTVPFGFWM